MSYWRTCEKCSKQALEKNLYGIFSLCAIFTVTTSQGTHRHFTLKVNEPWVCTFCNYSKTQIRQHTHGYF